MSTRGINFLDHWAGNIPEAARCTIDDCEKGELRPR
ncbi:DUF768 domain-containing protein [Mesorhizobium sp. B2-1-3A]|nr:DUF768 domain-containing protein [Mesorhizobium sp. B2-1-3A]